VRTKPGSCFLTRAWKPTPEETFIWVVTKTALRWVRSDLGTAALTREVLALRCGLDAEAWNGPRCPELAGSTYPKVDSEAGKPPPFHQARAHRPYNARWRRRSTSSRASSHWPTHAIAVPGAGHAAARGLLAQSAAACGEPESGTSISYPFVSRLLQC
jgi:hypothetical protein